MTESWYYSTDDERPGGSSPFGSREQAIAAACAELDPGQKYFTCRAGDPLDHVHVDPDSVLEEIGVQMYDLAGDPCEGWPSYAGNSEAGAKLKEDINKLILDYLKEHDPPAFWLAEDFEEHTVPGGCS